MTLKAVLFDFHATLMRSKPWIDLEVRELPSAAFTLLAARSVIAPLTPEQLSTAEEIFRQARQCANESGVETSHADNLLAMLEALDLTDAVPVSVANEIVATLHRDAVDTVQIINGATETLQKLLQLGFRLAIVSNAAYSPFLTWTLQRFALIEFFEEIVVSADVRTRKPWTDIFGIVLDRMQLKPNDTVYVGDDYEKDMVSAKHFGMRAIWFRPNGSSNSGEDESVPDVIVSALDQIPPVVERWRDE